MKSGTASTALDDAIDRLRTMLGELRRHLHAHPEPSGEEIETTRHLAGVLVRAGLDARVVADGTGLIVEPKGQAAGQRIAFRADTDALRISDEKAVAYRSTRPGVAHACGHDVHATIAAGAALALAATAPRLPKALRWRAIFQPAEENSTGAKRMVEAGAVDDVAAIVGLHVDPERNYGRTGFTQGTLTAFCNEVDVVVRGAGGHAARPHHAADPIAAAVQLVASAYQGLPRAVDSRDPAVLTFGSIHGGSARNVIPEEVRLTGTARTHSVAARDALERKLRAIGEGIEAMSCTRIELTFRHGPDAIINDPGVTAICEQATLELLGPLAVEPITVPSLGGEDFSEYLATVPGCFFRLGTRRGDERTPLLHSGHFDVDDDVLVLGAKLLARCVLALSERHAP